MTMEEHTKAIADLTAAIAALTTKIEDIHPVVHELQGWRPQIEQSVEEIRSEVGHLRTQIDKATLPPPVDRATATAPPPPLPRLSELPPLLPLIADGSRPRLPPPTADAPHLRAVDISDRGDTSHGPDGHGVFTDLRGKSSGEIRTPRLPPATGTSDFYHHGEQSFAGDRGYFRLPPPPRFDFPLFDGSNPRAWRLKCEAYFWVCTLSADTWVSCAEMYFTDNALSWLQSSQAHLHYQEWGEFASVICAQFGREEFQNLLRQFNRLRQTGTVTKYAEQFTQLMHNLLAHHSSWDPAFFVTQFMDGLQRDIRVAVVLHQPQTLDTAVDLACLQEEVVEALRRDERRHPALPPSSQGGRAIPRMALPLPPPPSAIARQGGTASESRPPETTRTPPNDDKLATLRAYRRAKGLCFTCGERWSREHRCAPTVQLHIVEELIEMLQGPAQPTPSTESTPSEADCCVLSQAAVDGAEAPTTMRLHGWVQGKEVLMLVDSGSSHSFVSAALATHLQGVKPAHRALSVRVANGSILQSDQEIPACKWNSQGVEFTTNLRVLPLGSYDVILGIDWLADHSPMKVHWLEKTMAFQHDG
ncbi:uncharacterized protein LOC125507475 [Triticum urartu]|uniref:uncharacterized protein LOC125507475 n=1 Tax=Triticum urartu TaxID=4572 RepID=UPI002044A967|nr:uncharacterized protein LOC125507475 [Triticum urartu]